MRSPMDSIEVIDSHTGGEPTRVVTRAPDDLNRALGEGPLRGRLARLRAHFDHVRRAVALEPRGSDVVVGAFLCPPEDEAASTGVIFFNNVGWLGMCGHGTIGVVRTLEHLGAIGPGEHTIDTWVGPVRAELFDDGRVSVRNVMSHRAQSGVTVDVPGYGDVTGDVAYGGNWFFLVTDGPEEKIEAGRADELTRNARSIRAALEARGITGDDGAVIDHIELFGPPENPENDSRNFVLCPGGAYDRSPCGTGTSAKLACLAADGKVAPGEVWRQESVIGSVFEATYEPGPTGDVVCPTITGRAFITGESRLVFEVDDPFRNGIGSHALTSEENAG